MTLSLEVLKKALAKFCGRHRYYSFTTVSGGRLLVFRHGSCFGTGTERGCGHASVESLAEQVLIKTPKLYSVLYVSREPSGQGAVEYRLLVSLTKDLCNC